MRDIPARFLVEGDTALVVDFGEEISPDVFAMVQSLHSALSSEALLGIVEYVPTYRSLMIIYNPDIAGFKDVESYVRQHWSEDIRPLADGRVVVIPTCYGGEFGPDLQELSAMVSLSADEVIAEHCSSDYLIYMLGFTPGFPYLGGLSARIACPRLSSPRTLVPAGSVGIAEQQTGIYPLATPGGWRIIGRTPVRLFDPTSDQPFPLQAGDWLRFQPISLDEYTRIEAAIALGEWQPAISSLSTARDTAKEDVL